MESLPTTTKSERRWRSNPLQSSKSLSSLRLLLPRFALRCWTIVARCGEQNIAF
uniref:Uncharacterized protein n=1 Tax=Manihot esculenta TaxID=3983 RepID=A0A2C9UB12_MANES